MYLLNSRTSCADKCVMGQVDVTRHLKRKIDDDYVTVILENKKQSCHCYLATQTLTISYI
jgi:hypothetical protein